MISEKDVLAVQNLWGDGIVKIGTLKNNKCECEAFASGFLNKLYAFKEGKVLFKPTKCAIKQFRSTKAEALSYFIAGKNRACIEDKGFAIYPWAKVRFENSNLILEKDRAIALGNYFFTDMQGQESKIEYTFGYKLIDGMLKIDVNHSSFPYKINDAIV
ncbi:hypothetical protein [Aquimarina agarivorans]|uniref:hypothetical protein n=1 Tax=Aquimarina agarivorans TaxID=980584 RepID=UPI000248F891|nr:hypothetical protein [Aquimarina agarivorans]